MKSQKIHFINTRGIKLFAVLDSPDSNVTSYAILAHCFTCSKDLKAYRSINESLTLSGIAVLRFDFTGIWESKGDFSDTNFSTMTEDIISASDFLGRTLKMPKLLIGHSIGGCAVIIAAKKIQSVNAVVTIGTPAEPANLSLKLSKAKEKAILNGIGDAAIGGKKYKFKKQFFDDLESYKLETSISTLRKPLLILHSPKDTYTSIENAAKIFQAARHPKSFISLGDMDHLMLKKSDASYVGSLIAAWSKRYL